MSSIISVRKQIAVLAAAALAGYTCSADALNLRARSGRGSPVPSVTPSDGTAASGQASSGASGASNYSERPEQSWDLHDKNKARSYIKAKLNEEYVAGGPYANLKEAFQAARAEGRGWVDDQNMILAMFGKKCVDALNYQKPDDFGGYTTCNDRARKMMRDRQIKFLDWVEQVGNDDFEKVSGERVCAPCAARPGQFDAGLKHDLGWWPVSKGQTPDEAERKRQEAERLAQVAKELEIKALSEKRLTSTENREAAEANVMEWERELVAAREHMKVSIDTEVGVHLGYECVFDLDDEIETSSETETQTCRKRAESFREPGMTFLEAIQRVGDKSYEFEVGRPCGKCASPEVKARVNHAVDMKREERVTQYNDRVKTMRGRDNEKCAWIYEASLNKIREAEEVEDIKGTLTPAQVEAIDARKFVGNRARYNSNGMLRPKIKFDADGKQLPHYQTKNSDFKLVDGAAGTVIEWTPTSITLCTTEYEFGWHSKTMSEGGKTDKYGKVAKFENQPYDFVMLVPESNRVGTESNVSDDLEDAANHESVSEQGN